MPGLSGGELAARVSIDRPEIRVLYTSGYTENVMIRAGFEGRFGPPSEAIPPGRSAAKGGRDSWCGDLTRRAGLDEAWT
jgi:hypothetical protein